MPDSSKTSITFHGGAGTVTGANFLFERDGRKFLIDCGLFQGRKIVEDKNREPFPYAPSEIEALFVTHAHLDHVGRIPKLVHAGFRGPIYSTPPTKDLAELILTDSLGVMSKEARGENRALLYEEADVKATLGQWQTVAYREPFNLNGLQVTFRDAGHILGSAMVEFVERGRKVLFTGDLGNSPAPLLNDTELVTGINYLVMESVYGDRRHEAIKERQDKLEDKIEETMQAGGTLLIPAFSIERTQEILYEIEHMVAAGRIPSVPVYLDSPLAIQVTAVYKKFQAYLSGKVVDPNLVRDGIFNFPNLRKTLATDESKAIPFNERKIIIAGSGMSNGGRIIHHEKHYLPAAKNTLLLVGYQSIGSLGRRLQDGDKLVRILGQDVPVNARVVTISGYSAHRDTDGLLDFVNGSADSLEQVYVVMGEPKSSLFLAQRVRDYLGLEARVPRAGETVELY